MHDLNIDVVQGDMTGSKRGDRYVLCALQEAGYPKVNRGGQAVYAAAATARASARAFCYRGKHKISTVCNTGVGLVALRTVPRFANFWLRRNWTDRAVQRFVIWDDDCTYVP